jgi:polyisoprenoid-binding protein YceI
VIGLCLAALVWWLNRDIEAQDPILATQTPIPSAQYFRAAPDESMLKMIVHSRFGDIDGLFQLGESSVELEPAGDGWYVVANLIFDARTLDIGSDQLNTAMRRALEVDKYPSGIFVARSSTPITDLSVAQQVDLMGQMELHGSVQDYTIVTVVEINGDKLTLSAQMTIDSAQFGISIPALIAENDLDTDMQVVAYRAEKGTP